MEAENKQAQQTKKVYSAPKLVEFGDLSVITKNDAGLEFDLGPSGSKF